MSAPQWKCPQCGQQVEEQFNYCWKCGTASEDWKVAPAARAAGRNRSQRIAIGLAAMVAILVAGGVLWKQVRASREGDAETGDPGRGLGSWFQDRAGQAAAEEHQMQAENYARNQQWEQAAASYEAYRKLFEKGSYPALTYNNLAWVYVAGPKPLRDLEKALPLAQKAVEQNPQEPHSLNTLGVVYYRLDQLDEAVETLNQAVQANSAGGTAFDFYFLAMSHHRRGQPQKAQEYYEKADGWRKRPSQATQGLTEFRLEADALLTGRPLEQVEAEERQQLIEALQNPDANERRKAANALVRMASQVPAEAETPLKFGVVRSQADSFQMVFASAARVLHVQTDDGRASVLVGDYQVIQASLTRIDDRGRRWELQTSGGGGETVQVVAEETTELQLGSAVQIQARPHIEGRTVNFSLQSTAAGLPVSGITVDGKSPSVPKLRIQQTNGQEVGRYDFRYG